MSNEVKTVEKPMVELVHQLDEMALKWGMSLPAHITVDKFKRAAINAIQQNPDLVNADRFTLWVSCSRAAQDGLLPDGREGALVVFNNKVKVRGPNGAMVDKWIKAVTWMPMIAGIRKKVRNSGEIKDWLCAVVYARDKFSFRLGDDAGIEHEPYMGADDPGPVVAAYSLVKLKNGETSREVMSRREIDKVRAVSKSKDSGPWVSWFEEMARKTVARRHAKSLPQSTDLDLLTRREDDEYDPATGELGGAPQRPSLMDFRPIPSEQAGGPAEGEADDIKEQKGEEADPNIDAHNQQELTHPDAYALGMKARDGEGKTTSVPVESIERPSGIPDEFMAAWKEGWQARDAEIVAEVAKDKKGKEKGK